MPDSEDLIVEGSQTASGDLQSMHTFEIFNDLPARDPIQTVGSCDDGSCAGVGDQRCEAELT